MRTTRDRMLAPAAALCRTVAVALIAGVWRGQQTEALEARISALSRRDQALVVGGVLGFVFLLTLAAAQFGWPGLLAWFLVIILIVR